MNLPELPVDKLFASVNDYGVNTDSRIIFLTHDIEADNINCLVQNMNYMASISDKPITIIVNSWGGQDDCMLYAYDAMTTCPVPIVTIGTGMVCSAASLLLVAGDKRYCTPNTWFMTHKGKIEIGGDEDEVAAGQALHTKISDIYWKLISRHTKKSPQWWYDCSKDSGELWFDAKSMLKNGVIDGIIQPPPFRVLKPMPTQKVKRSKRRQEEEEDS